jgi:hypothetical protein
MTKQNRKESTSATRESSVKNIKASKITSGTVNANELDFININSNHESLS